MKTVSLALAAALAAVPGGAVAQKLEITPTVGLYLPAFDLIDENIPGSGQLTIGHKSGFALGGRVGYRLSPRVVVEGVFLYSPSDVSLNISGLGSGSESATITRVGGQFTFAVTAPTRPTVFHLSAGVAMALRGGTFWNDFEDALTAQGVELKGKNDFGGVIGVGLRTRLTPTLALRADLEDHIYQGKFTFHDTIGQVSQDTESQLQNDLRMIAGIVIAVGGK